MTPIRHIIWDWNGTLLDDALICVDVMNVQLRERGLPEMSADAYSEIFRFPVQDYYQEIGFDFSTESFEPVSDAFITGYAAALDQRAVLRGGTRDTLSRLRDAGYSQSILSAMKQSMLDQMIDRFDLRAYFTTVIGINDHHARGKLDQGLAWLESVPLTADQMVFVGDTLHDHEVAEALGTDCILIPSGHYAWHRLESVGVPVIAGLYAVADAIIGA